MKKKFRDHLWVLGLALPFFLCLGCPQNNPTGADASGAWVEATAHAAWSPRYGMGGAVFNGSMWLIGGASGPVTTYYGAVYNSSNGSQWTQKVGDNNSYFGNRYSPGVISFGSQLWVIGGNQNGTLKNDVWSSSNGVSWTQVSTTGPIFTPREDFIAIAYNGAMYVIGGWDGGVDGDIWTSNNGTNWSLVAPTTITSAIPGYGYGFRGRWGSAATVFNGKIYIFEGCDGNPNAGSLVATGVDDEWTFDGTNLTLVNDVGFSGNGSSPMVYHQITADKGLLWLTPGSMPGESTYAGTYTSADGMNWNYHLQYYLPRCGHTALSYNNQDWVMGGYNNQCWQVSGCAVTYYNDVWHSQ